MSGGVALAIAYHVASRLAYVFGIGGALLAEQRHRRFTRDEGIDAGFRRFSRLASWLLNNDAVSFVVLCLVTRDTLHLALPGAVVTIVGLLLIAGGLLVKRWAAKSLPPGAYHWRDSFDRTAAPAGPPRGPYRLLRNPMYTVGYAHAYGFALLTRSSLGLVAAVFDQVAILLFHRIVEQPYYRRLRQAGS